MGTGLAMQQIFVVGSNIISPLGKTAKENFDAILQGQSGCTQHAAGTLAPTPVIAAVLSETLEKEITGSLSINSASRAENLLIQSIRNSNADSDINLADKRTIFVYSSTKGNIDLIDDAADTVLTLHHTAQTVSRYFGNQNTPVVISNACISGVAAIIIAKRLIKTGAYDNVVVLAGDSISKFVVSGFQALQAMSADPCKPFDKSRNGINLGEAFSSMIISNKAQSSGDNITIEGGSISNDANHISGPSRTGEELNLAIQAALRQSDLQTNDIDFISAHGTATLYNDEMETKAFNLAGLQATPVNSMKGYFGHTLGAAGLVESIICINSLRNNVIIPTKGFEEQAGELQLNIFTQPIYKTLTHCLKTASGFGGCNAAVVFKKHV